MHARPALTARRGRSNDSFARGLRLLVKSCIRNWQEAGSMTSVSERDLQATVQAWDQAAWSLAALALGTRDDGQPELTAAAWELLAAAGLTGAPGAQLAGLGTSTPRQIASQAAAALHQASALASGRGYHWGAQSDEALLAQGHAGAQAAVPMARSMLPMMGDLASRVAAPGARMLDVGTGVAALAVSFAQGFPELHVLGIDILDRALDLARQAIAASDVAARVTVRKQDVAEFADDAGFDVAWLPAPFIPQPAVHAGLPRVAAALHPGGWLILGHGKLGGTPVEDAVTRLKTIAHGGTTLDEAAACQLLRDAGLTSVRPMPTPAGAPAITVGQKPA
jgi:predicted O-methyltransferase YrrM